MLVSAASKIPLLIISAACNKVALTAPNPPPHPEEREKYSKERVAQEHGRFSVLHAAVVWQNLAYIIDAVEILACLTTLYPPLLTYIQRTRIPADATLASKISITPAYALGFAMTVFGTLLRATAYRQLGRNFTFQLAVRKEHKLVTDGLYSIVRHPSYTGAYAFLIGSAICHAGPGSYWVVSGMWHGLVGQGLGLAYFALLAYMFVGMINRTKKEDGILREEFQEQWDAWASETRYRLLPLVY